MRRSRAPLSAWPAFADVMTILAVVSLAVAAFALSGKDPELIKTLKRKLKKAEETIQEQEIRIRELTWTQIGQPCLWDPGPPPRVFPLLRISVAAPVRGCPAAVVGARRNSLYSRTGERGRPG